MNNAAAGEMTISGGTFEGNNRAITNDNKLTLNNVNVTAGSGSSKNDVNTTGEMILTGTNNLNNDITGSGSIENRGVLNLTGDNSQYTGEYLQAQGTTNVNDGKFFSGTSTISGGTLNWLISNPIEDTAKLTVSGNGTKLNIGNDTKNTTLTIQNGSSIANEAQIAIAAGSTLGVDNNGTVNIISGPLKIAADSSIKNDANVIIANNSTLKVTGGGLQQISGTSIFKDNSSLYFGAGTSELNVDNLTMDGSSLLNVMNGKLNTSNITNMTVNGKNDVSINITPRDWTHDKFVVDTLKSDSKGTVNISDFDFLGYALIDRHIKMQIFDVKSIQNVKFDTTDKEIFTPIGWYDLKSVGAGYFTSNMVRYNPLVFRGQVATQAMYNNQLAIDDMLLNHLSLQSERLLAQGHNANKYAINSSQFAPYQYKKEDGGLWFKSYVNFETLSLTRGLHVNNNAYGSIVGADFPVVNMKNGWKFMPTAFIAYNGFHQTFSKVAMYPNGGQGGFMGTFMKDDFIGSVLAYGGGYSNEMSVARFKDYSF